MDTYVKLYASLIGKFQLQLLQPIDYKTHKHSILLISIFFLYLVLATSYSIITPAFEGPDEDSHYRFSLFMYDGNVPQGKYHTYVTKSPMYYIINAGMLHFLDPGEQRSGYFIPKNYDYPIDPARFHHSTEEYFPFSGVVAVNHALRFLPVFFGLVTLFFVYKIGLLIFENNKWLALFTTALISVLPTFLWINSVMNTDSLVWMFSTITLFLFLKFVTNNKIKFLLLTAVFTILAISAKPNALILFPTIVIGLFFLLKFKQTNLKKFFKNLFVFISVSAVSSIWLYLFRIFHSGIQKGSENINSIETVPFFGNTISLFSGDINLGDSARIFNYSFVHNRIIEFSLSGMGWNTIWLPHIYYSFADSLLLVSIIGLIWFFKKSESLNFKIKKIHLVVIFSSAVLMIIILFYNWLFTQVGLARYLFPVVASYGILLTLGWYMIFNRKKLKILMFVPLTFLLIVNVGNLSLLDTTFSYNFRDFDGDGIMDSLDLIPTKFSNDFKLSQYERNSFGTILNRDNSFVPIDIESKNLTLKQLVYGHIQTSSPTFEQLIPRIKSYLQTSHMSDDDVNRVLTELEDEKKIVKHNGIWKIPTQKLTVSEKEGRIVVMNEPSDLSYDLLVEICDHSTIVSIPPESGISFYCDLTGKSQLEKIDYSSFLPSSIENGNLIQGENRIEVYIVQNGLKHHIAKPHVFDELGFTTDMIKHVPDEIIDSIPTGKVIKSANDL